MRKIAHSPTPRENLLPLKRFDVMDINSFRSMHSLLKSNCTIGIYLNNRIRTSSMVIQGSRIIQ